MRHNPAEHVVKIFPWIDVEIFAGLNQTHIERRRMPAPFAADKKPVFSSQGHRPHGVFRRIVVGLEITVFQIPAKRDFLIQAVVDGLSDRLRWNCLALEVIQSCKYIIQNRFGLLLP